jgi:hypothetical protein
MMQTHTFGLVIEIFLWLQSEQVSAVVAGECTACGSKAQCDSCGEYQLWVEIFVLQSCM